MIKYENVEIVKSKFKVKTVTKTNIYVMEFKRKWEKKTFKYIYMMSATRPINICLLILHINTCEYYNNFMTKYISITYLLS